MISISPDTPIQRNPDLIATDMDGDTVMMSIESGEYFGVGGVGPRVWELLERTTDVGMIVQAIRSEYEVEAATCQEDMLQFVANLMEHGLVRRCRPVTVT